MTLFESLYKVRVITAKTLVSLRKDMVKLGVQPSPMSEDFKKEVSELTGETCP